MVDVPITIACGNYDRTQAIKDGVVKVEGCAVTYLPLYPEEIFFRAFRYAEFDVSEISFSSYIRTVAAGTSAYIGIPAFVSRIFRHSGIYVRKDAGIRTPQDLRGKRIGLPEYQITAVVWMRGLLQHEYGVHPSEIHWRSGGQEEPGRHERTPLKAIPGLDLQPIGDDQTLVDMLRKGELDALFTARAPSSFLAGEPHIARLFPDTRAAEIAYYKKTGLFPIMHLIGIRRSLVEKHPWLGPSVLKAFTRAKAIALEEMADVGISRASLPWLPCDVAHSKAIMGGDIWPYGYPANKKAVDCMLRWSVEQGLSDRAVTPEELFAPGTLQDL